MASHGGGESAAGASAAAEEVDDGSLAGYDSLDAMLAAHLPPDKLREARRVLYGARCSADASLARVCGGVRLLGADAPRLRQRVCRLLLTHPRAVYTQATTAARRCRRRR
jgi:hypothetical protein